ncbi:MAG: ABC transporter permease [Clostridiales bacterium]|nr:ABC transporter permease [Clostridiales bacterium]
MKINRRIKSILINSAVPLLFLIISALAIPIAQYSGSFLFREIITRLTRNSFLVLSLLLPVMAGMGINFGMILGAMAGQVGIVFVTEWGITGAGGLTLAALVGTPVAILLGWFAGNVLNRAKGREMITSMIFGMFIAGVYQFFMLYLCGTIIPFKNPLLILSHGYGVRNAINLDVKGGFDNLFMLWVNRIPIPLGTFAIIGVLCLVTAWLRKTKLGQDMRAVGQDNDISESSGINVEKTRVLSVIISTVIACYGQIIYLQNVGTLNTYNGADQAALFAAASLLVGGATVSRATVPNAIVGTALFHLMFIIMPIAGKNLTGQAMLGEYFRMFISYGVITIALALHAWSRKKNAEGARIERMSE